MGAQPIMKIERKYSKLWSLYRLAKKSRWAFAMYLNLAVNHRAKLATSGLIMPGMSSDDGLELLVNK